MNRISVLIGTWASVVVVAGACLALDPKKPGNQPVSPTPQPAPSRSSVRTGTPPANGGNHVDTSRQANDARRAAAAAAAAAASAAEAARSAAAARSAGTQQNSNNSGYSRHWPYDYGNGYYSPYGYSPYGYSPYGSSYSPYGYYPPGTTPYVLGYNPVTGTTFLYPYGGSGYASNYPPYGNQYPYYQNPYLGYGYPAAVFAPAGQLFGLGPIQQLMGVAGWFQPPQANANAANGNGNGGNANPGLANNNNARPDPARHDADPPAPKAKPAGGGRAMELAWKFITYGDAHFGNHKYSDALDRYRRATRECPTLGDAWFREGFALAVLGRYDQAAKALRRGLEEKPDWVDTNFRLNEVYGDDTTEKKARLDTMVKAAEAQPTNGDLAFVVGVHLYCEGKQDEAAPFLHRAAQIFGTDADVKPFLAK